MQFLEKYHKPIAVAPADAAKIAGIGRTKLYAALSSGELPSFKIGTRRLIRVSAIEAWLASHETASASK
ncbi:helix-turn-helix domain-containing protein [Hirschia litorea]|uniref:Helix-turn-helix domain-containing protein n=1 Tax=Hirschia litorea TaxID=1199156 RepID=A0ABW2IHB0_9PROT